MRHIKKLTNKVLLIIVGFAVIITLSVSVAVSASYYKEMRSEYQKTAFGYAYSAADFIDGSTIDMYSEQTEADPKDYYYDDIQSFLDAFEKSNDIRFYYVIVPYEDEMLYIWDAKNDMESLGLGTRMKYKGDEKDDIFREFSKKPSAKFYVSHDDKYGYIGTAYAPIYDYDGEPVALVGVDVDMNDVEKAISRFILSIVMCVTVPTLIAATVLYSVTKRFIVNPIGIIRKAAKEMVDNLEGNPEPITVKTGDEIEELSVSFNTMNIELRDYIKRFASVTAEKERIGTELELARRIQADMLPNSFPAFPDRNDFDIYAEMLPAKEVGGDFYDFFMPDDDHLAMVIADVSGKGIPAALFMMMSKILVHDQTMRETSPKEVLTAVNEQICSNNKEEMFVTLWLGILDLRTGILTAASAGHEKPVLMQPGGAFEVIYDKHGIPLGALEDARYKEYELILKPGAKLFVYTDGVPEATDSYDELFGLERLTKALNSVKDRTVKEITETVREKTDKFVGDASQFDDLTMLCLQYFGSKKSEITVPAKTESIERVSEFFIEKLSDCSLDEETVSQIEIITDEIISNIAGYAYPENEGELTASITVSDDKDIIELCFTDSGVQYDPTAKPDLDTTLSDDERPIGGCGIFIVKNLADSVSYDRRGGKNILKITKSLKKHDKKHRRR